MFKFTLTWVSEGECSELFGCNILINAFLEPWFPRFREEWGSVCLGPLAGVCVVAAWLDGMLR